MKILSCIFFVVILLYMTSKLKINIRSLTKQENSLKIQFRVNVGIYLLGVIKVFGISFKEDGIHFLCFHFRYPNVKIDKESMKMFKKFSIIDILKMLKIKLDKFHFNLQIGTEDIMLTVFFVCVISTMLSILSAQNAKSINLKNYDYQIAPIYNKNALSFRNSSQISFSIPRLFKTIALLKKQNKLKQENHLNRENLVYFV